VMGVENELVAVGVGGVGVGVGATISIVGFEVGRLGAGLNTAPVTQWHQQHNSTASRTIWIAAHEIIKEGPKAIDELLVPKLHLWGFIFDRLHLVVEC